jgi:Na+/proline symporter
MESLDYLLVGLYVVFLIGMGVYLNRRQQSAEDYYVGGRTVAWWASGTSTMATQLGTISFVSAPAFVALKDVKEGGGLGWLTYEFGVPLALIFIMMYLIPTYHRARVISIYEYIPARRSMLLCSSRSAAGWRQGWRSIRSVSWWPSSLAR